MFIKFSRLFVNFDTYLSHHFWKKSVNLIYFSNSLRVSSRTPLKIPTSCVCQKKNAVSEIDVYDVCGNLNFVESKQTASW